MECDSYLNLKDADEEVEPNLLIEERKMKRFISILRRLPLEMQMRVCNLSQNLDREIIPVSEITPALKDSFQSFEETLLS